MMKLKCCPFCGSKPEFNFYRHPLGEVKRVVECSNDECLLYMPDETAQCATFKQAAKIWNKRTKSKRCFEVEIPEMNFEE